MIYPEVYLCCSPSLALPSKIQFYEYSSYTLSTFCLSFPIYLETCYLTVFPYIGLNAYSDIKAFPPLKTLRQLWACNGQCQPSTSLSFYRKSFKIIEEYGRLYIGCKWPLYFQIAQLLACIIVSYYHKNRACWWVSHNLLFWKFQTLLSQW